MRAIPKQSGCQWRVAWRIALKWVLIPAVFYLAAFCLLTWPVIMDFSRGIWAGGGDGLQGAHGLWWFQKAVLELRANPWFTHYLNHPEGCHLFLYPLVPSNSMLGLVAVPWLGLNQAYNAVILFTFVMSGLTAFWLVLAVVGAYWPAWLGGFIYTFSNYHFAHAQGHMTLVSMQWLPLFVLCWWKLLSEPKQRFAVFSALALLLVMGCDSYYFLYCVTAGALMAAYVCVRQRDAMLFLRPAYRLPLLLFVVLTLCTAGVLAYATLRFMSEHPPRHHFSPEGFSLDGLALFIPGGHWRFREWTEWYWSRLPGNIHESSVHIGFGVLGLVAVGVLRKTAAQAKDKALWVVLGLFFVVLALGPALFVAGQRMPYIGRGGYIPMPYTWVEHLFPPLLVGARPVRMVIIFLMVCAILGAAGAQRLWQGGMRSRSLLMILLALMVVEYLPTRIPLTIPEVPPFVRTLAAVPGADGFYDGVTPNENLAMYHQTIHDKPIPFARLARSNQKLASEQAVKHDLFERGDLTTLRDRYGFRYFRLARDWPHVNHYATYPCLHEDEKALLLDLGRTEP